MSSAKKQTLMLGAPNMEQKLIKGGRGENMEIVRIIATAANAVAAVCDIILLVLLWRWYGPNAKQ